MHNENNNEHQNLYLSAYDKQAYNESDVIISVIGEKITNYRHIHNYYGEMMFFNVTKVRESRTLQFADLRLFKKSYKTQNYQNDNSKNISFEDNCDFYFIEVYELRKSKNLNHHLVTKSVVNKNYEGWITLNISSLFYKWLRHPETNNGIYVNVFPMNESCENKNLTLGDIGIVNVESEPKRDMDPFIVGYLKTSYGIDDSFLDDSVNDFRLKRDLRQLIIDKSYHVPKVRKHVGRYGSCQVRPFTISFSDFGWADFIIAPVEYKLSFCAGDCSLSSFITERDTMHSYLQLLAHSAYPDRVPIPCCAAKKFSSMDILYYGNNQNIILEKMKRIAVASCQCL
ncbi:protein 60A-like [Microplitis demolitor]|uniref:protein 60A-like n=1 Tax=Microplitis demolitor TaxID=69319 RepID=UPI0004CCD7A3|nr:protein 60A-like [Microplitis demolitor]